MAKPVLKFGNLPIVKRVSRTRQIVIATTGNANYTDPVPSLASITTSVNLLEADDLAAKDGPASAMTARNLQNKSHLGVMNQFVTYVEVASGGDQVKIETTTLAVKALPGASVAMGKVTGVKGKVGSFAGQSDLSWKKMVGANFYQVQRSADGTTLWADQGEAVTKARTTINGMVSESGSFFRVAAGNTLGIGSWSDPIRVMAM